MSEYIQQKYFLNKLNAARDSLNWEDDAETHLLKVKEIARLEMICEKVLLIPSEIMNKQERGEK
jgi:hypothetical protein